MKEFWETLEELLGENFAENLALHRDVLQLSQQLTQQRDELDSDYLNSEQMQKAYMAYYMPLNFEKMRMLLNTHSNFWPKNVIDPHQKNLRWIDLGCGPGTATLAALASFKHRYKNQELPQIEIDLIDSQQSNLDSAQEIIQRFADKLKLTVKLNPSRSLEKTLNSVKESYNIGFAANMLNELPAEKAGQSSSEKDPVVEVWKKTSGSFFLLEPSHRVSSQRLVRVRERLCKIKNDHAFQILGPCLHSERCPVHRTQHWCHFSEPLTDGRLIDLNLRIFKDPRLWLKFSYLITKRVENFDQISKPKSSTKIVYRAIGDLHMSGPQHLAIDLCQPSEKKVLRTTNKLPPELKSQLVRGALVFLDAKEVESLHPNKTPHIEAKPLTPRKPLKTIPQTRAQTPPRATKVNTSRTSTGRSRSPKRK